jgi:hypothetical protein
MVRDRIPITIHLFFQPRFDLNRNGRVRVKPLLFQNKSLLDNRLAQQIVDIAKGKWSIGGLSSAGQANRLAERSQPIIRFWAVWNQPFTLSRAFERVNQSVVFEVKTPVFHPPHPDGMILVAQTCIQGIPAKPGE